MQTVPRIHMRVAPLQLFDVAYLEDRTLASFLSQHVLLRALRILSSGVMLHEFGLRVRQLAHACLESLVRHVVITRVLDLVLSL